MKIKEIIRYAALGVLLIANGALLNSAEAAKGDFVIIGKENPDIVQEIRYYTSYNFVGERITGYEELFLSGS